MAQTDLGLTPTTKRSNSNEKEIAMSEHTKPKLTRRQMIRLGVAAGALAAASPMLSGCGATSATPTPSGPVDVTFWHVWGATRLPLVEQQIKDFEARTPNIKIKHTLIPSAGMDEKYLTAIAGGDPPDVMMIHGMNHLPTFAAKGVLLALDKYVDKDKIKPNEVWFPAEYNTYVWQKKPYCLPFATGTGFFLLFYNKGHFKDAGLDPAKPPRTWTEAEQYTAKLTVKKGTAIDRVGFDPAQGGAAANYVIREWTFLNNGNIISADGKKIMYNSPEGIDALKWVVGIYENAYGGFDKVQAMVSGAGSAPYREAFQTKKVSMEIDGVWLPLTIKTDAPDVDYGIAVLPYNDKNSKAKQRNIVEGGWGYGITKGSKRPDQAWEWLKWTCMDTGNLEFFKAQLRPSPVIKFKNDPYFVQNSPYWSEILKAIDNSEVSPASPAQSKLNQITKQLVEEALLKKKTPEEAIKWGATESQKALDEWWAQQK